MLINAVAQKGVVAPMDAAALVSIATPIDEAGPVGVVVLKDVVKLTEGPPTADSSIPRREI